MLTIPEFLDSERDRWDNREKAIFYLSIPTWREKEGYILDYLSESVEDAHEQTEVDKHKHLLSTFCADLYDEMVETYGNYLQAMNEDNSEFLNQ
tara:strand:+ start:720 stop:1001 length:282 start_codon:yes stop_codon:yes gene_type:complete